MHNLIEALKALEKGDPMCEVRVAGMLREEIYVKFSSAICQAGYVTISGRPVNAFDVDKETSLVTLLDSNGDTVQVRDFDVRKDCLSKFFVESVSGTNHCIRLYMLQPMTASNLRK